MWFLARNMTFKTSPSNQTLTTVETPASSLSVALVDFARQLCIKYMSSRQSTLVTGTTVVALIIPPHSRVFCQEDSFSIPLYAQPDTIPEVVEGSHIREFFCFLALLYKEGEDSAASQNVIIT